MADDDAKDAEAQGWWKRIPEGMAVTRWHLEAVQLCFPGFIKSRMTLAAWLVTEPDGYYFGGYPI